MVNLQIDFRMVNKKEQTNKQKNPMMILLLFVFKF